MYVHSVGLRAGNCLLITHGMHDVENLHIGIYNNSTSVVVAKTSDVGKNVSDSRVNKCVSYSV